MPPELRTPPAPRALAHLVPLYYEIASARQAGFGSPQPLSWSELDAYIRLSGDPLTPAECQLLRAIDAAWMSTWRDAQQQQQAAAKSPATRRPR